MPTIEAKVGPQFLQDGAIATVREGKGAELVLSDAHGRYVEPASRGAVFYLGVTNATATAYTGAGAGTPLFALHNPSSNTGKLAAILSVDFALRTSTGTSTAQTELVAWAGVSAQPTGTTTRPFNMLTQTATGSTVLAFSNTALTGSTALNIVLPLFTYYWTTPAVNAHAEPSPNPTNIDGLLVAAPGNQVAIGMTVVPTSATFDLAVVWEELSY